MENKLKTFLSHIQKTDNHWIWKGGTCASQRALTKRYGVWSAGFKGERHSAHNWAYRFFVSNDIPVDMVVDHKCEETLCCNPDHLQLKSKCENPGQKQREATQCIKGHEFNGENTYITPDGRRQCKACQGLRQASFTARQALRKELYLA